MPVEKIWDGTPDNCNGSTTVFPITFDYGNDANNVEVILLTVATGATSTLTPNTDYTVDAATDQVTTTTTYSSDYQLLIQPNPPRTQTIDLEKNGVFDADTIDGGFDKGAIIDQIHDVEIGRSLRVVDTPVDSLPGKTARKDKYLKFDSNGDPIPVDLGDPTLIDPTAFMTDFLEAQDKERAWYKLAAANQLRSINGLTFSEMQDLFDEQTVKDLHGYTMTVTRTGALAFGASDSLIFRGFRNGTIDFQVSCDIGANAAGPQFINCDCDIKLSGTFRLTASTDESMVKIDTQGDVEINGGTFNFQTFSCTTAPALDIVANEIWMNANTMSGSGSCVTFLKADAKQVRLTSNPIGTVTITTGLQLVKPCFLLKDNSAITATTEISVTNYEDFLFGGKNVALVEKETYLKHRLMSMPLMTAGQKAENINSAQVALIAKDRSGQSFPELFLLGIDSVLDQDQVVTNKLFSGALASFVDYSNPIQTRADTGSGHCSTAAISDNGQNIALAGYTGTTGFIAESNDGGATFAINTWAFTGDRGFVLGWVQSSGQFVLKASSTLFYRWTPGNWATKSSNSFTQLGRHGSMAGSYFCLHGKASSGNTTNFDLLTYNGTSFSEQAIDFSSKFPVAVTKVKSAGMVLFEGGTYKVCVAAEISGATEDHWETYLFTSTDRTNWTRGPLLAAGISAIYGIGGKIEGTDFYYLVPFGADWDTDLMSDGHNFYGINFQYERTIFASKLTNTDRFPIFSPLLDTSGGGLKDNVFHIFQEQGLIYFTSDYGNGHYYYVDVKQATEGI